MKIKMIRNINNDFIKIYLNMLDKKLIYDESKSHYDFENDNSELYVKNGFKDMKFHGFGIYLFADVFLNGDYNYYKYRISNKYQDMNYLYGRFIYNLKLEDFSNFLTKRFIGKYDLKHIKNYIKKYNYTITDIETFSDMNKRKLYYKNREDYYRSIYYGKFI